MQYPGLVIGCTLKSKKKKEKCSKRWGQFLEKLAVKTPPNIQRLLKTEKGLSHPLL